jgi:DNA repair exonuclease SbcCD ATPase subunit
MPKIVAPPAIRSLDAFIDLLTDHEKYLGYMKELKVMKDDIVALLDTLQTKEQADTFLGQAATKLNEIQQREAALDHREQESRALCEQRAHEAEGLVQAAHKKQAETTAWVAEQERSIADKVREISARESEATAREARVTAREQQVASREAQLEDELNKLRRTKELLASVQ